MSLLTDLLDEYRALLLRRDRVVVAQIGRSYAAVSKALKEQLAGLTEQQGGSWVWRAVRRQRLQDLLAQVEQQLTAWAADVAPDVVEAQRSAAMLGTEYPGALAGMYGVRASFNALPAGTIERIVGMTADGTPLGDLLARIGPAVREAWAERLTLGIARGDNPLDVARAVSRSTAMGFARAATIARTEMLRAYRLTAHDTARANEQVFDGWVWAASVSRRTCPACLAMHGTFHPLSEAFNDHPNGRCQAVYTMRGRLDGAQARAELPDAEEWLRGLDENEQGRVLGVGRARLWRSGAVELRDLAMLTKNAVWGDTYQPTPLYALLTSAVV